MPRVARIGEFDRVCFDPPLDPDPPDRSVGCFDASDPFEASVVLLSCGVVSDGGVLVVLLASVVLAGSFGVSFAGFVAVSVSPPASEESSSATGADASAGAAFKI